MEGCHAWGDSGWDGGDRWGGRSPRLGGGDADPYWSIYSPTGVRMSGPYCP